MAIRIPDPGFVGAGEANVARGVGTPRNIDVGVRRAPQNTAYASADAFGAGAGAGLASLGRGIGNLGEALGRIGDEIISEQATAALMQQEMIQREIVSEYYNDIALGKIPFEEQGGATLSTYLTDGRQRSEAAIASLDAVRLAGVRNKLDLEWDNAASLATVTATKHAVLAKVADARQRQKNAAVQAIDHGDRQRFDAIVDAMNIPPGDKEDFRMQGHKALDENSLAILFENDPRGTADKLLEDETFLPDITGADRIRAVNSARMAANRKESQVLRDWAQDAQNGRPPNREDIEFALELGQIGEGAATEWRKIADGAMPTPEASARYMDLESRAMAYDPAADPDLSEWIGLHNEAASFHPEQQRLLHGILDNRRNPGERKRTNAWYFGRDQINKMFASDGIMPMAGIDEAEPYAGDPAKGMVLSPEARNIRDGLMTDLEVWIEQHPHATVNEVDQFVRQASERYRMGSGASILRKDILNRRPEIQGPPAPTERDWFAAEQTVYWPGPKGEAASYGLSGAVEGGPWDAHGNAIWGRTTYEDYLAGRGDYVTVAMDKQSDEFRNKSFLISPQFPGVLFRVMDNGGYGNNRTDTGWVDIAFSAPHMAKATRNRDVSFEVISDAEATKFIMKRMTEDAISERSRANAGD